MLAESNLQCQNCEAPVLQDDERCAKCGAKLLHRRVFFGVPKVENFALIAQDNKPEGDGEETVAWRDASEPEFPERAATAAPPVEPAPALRWGGFWRRGCALSIDLAVIALLAAVMGAMAYVGYKVGLGAHGLVIGGDNTSALFAILTLGWIALSSAYFIVLHGMGGQTVGKRLFGLRVVDAQRQPPRLRQAARRWFAVVGFAPIGLGFLWVMWQAEKRGWHDIVARTWVVRE